MRQTFKYWLQNRGIIVRRVKYRVAVPQNPLALQGALFRRMGQDRPIIFDIGANVGNVTAEYRSLFPGAEIYAFEPLPHLVEKLNKRFAADPMIQVIPLAVSDRVGTADFHLTGMDTTNSLRPRKKQTRRYYPKWTKATGETIEVRTTTLDSFCAERGLDRVDIMKFDIQGGEMAALKGGAEMLSSRSVQLIYTETAIIQHYEQEALLHELVGFLARHQFSLYDLYNLFRARNGQLRYGDAIFVSQSLRTEVLDSFPQEP